MSTTLEQTIATIPRMRPPEIGDAVRDRWDSLTKPRGSLGRLESDVVRMAEIQGVSTPSAGRRCMYVFCGDHGITEEGVSLYPSVVTREMVKNFVRGGAAINVLCRQLAITTFVVDAGVSGPPLDGVVDCRVAAGTRNFRRGPAMSREQAATAIERGIELAHDAAASFDLAGLGEMGIGNSTAASALLCVLAGVAPKDAVGRGTGLDDVGVAHKCAVLIEALAFHECDPADPLGVASAIGGFEIVMMAGFILGAASLRLPVVLDGFISGAAFLVARAFCPAVSELVFFGHRSAEHGHTRLLAHGGPPLLDLGLRLGEGTGAALAMGLLSSGVALFREMATFAEAAVSDVKALED
ncbi:MAG: Nicotinate-nucleotide--dimethylbenzimidazole phosphoribosyltransferase [Bryobacterales bacterium]|nr:Nicotinate-nucleotide--dimethylbenzimidazole phosphoribosyltransferase [Bryobacterales bacterium]